LQPALGNRLQSQTESRNDESRKHKSCTPASDKNHRRDVGGFPVGFHWCAALSFMGGKMNPLIEARWFPGLPMIYIIRRYENGVTDDKILITAKEAGQLIDQLKTLIENPREES
jgi:hypothetical protein